jgi:hypothetical protein
MYWGKLIPENKAVMDTFLVEHMQKMDERGGPLYQKLLKETGKTPEEERDFLIEKYELEKKIRHIKKVPKKGTFVFYLDKILP